jgi:Na+-transporting methylmalonyl-CoA/oxaloacetate decarboxylase gamma subunit
MLILDAVQVSIFGTLMVFLVLTVLNLCIRFQSIILRLFWGSSKKTKNKPKEATKCLQTDKPSEHLSKTSETESFLFTIDSKIYAVEVQKLSD